MTDWGGKISRLARKTSRLLREYLPDLILLLGAMLVFRIAPSAVETWWPEKEHYKSINVALKMLASALAITTAIAAYRRYFHGRLFAPRVDLGLECSLVGEMADGSLLHAVDVKLDNVGSVTVWDPGLTVRVRGLDSDDDCTEDGVACDGLEARGKKLSGLSGVSPAESLHQHYRFRVSKDLEALRISVELELDSGYRRFRSTTVANDSSGRDGANAATHMAAASGSAPFTLPARSGLASPPHNASPTGADGIAPDVGKGTMRLQSWPFRRARRPVSQRKSE